jgi:tetratricopeptide (TPR) repeat protein
MMHAHKALAHTLTPDSNYVLLAYLALLSEDTAKLRAYASEAVKWDPNSPNARWLMAEAYLAEGDREQAAREARLAREIDPSSTHARSALRRAQGESETRRLGVEKGIAKARSMFSKGSLTRAEFVLRRAISKSPGPCPECHRLLAAIYEADHLYENAIAEWQAFLGQAPDRASAEDAATRINTLQQMSRLRK